MCYSQLLKLHNTSAKKTVAESLQSATMDISEDKGNVEVHTVGKIDREIYKCITADIRTDEVIITDNQIQHIKIRHPNDYERFSEYFGEIVSNPDFIVETSKPNTALILKEIFAENEQFKTVLSLFCIEAPLSVPRRDQCRCRPSRAG